MEKVLNGKNVLITGGATGIGYSIAIAMAKEGANIIIADINLDAAQKAAQELSSFGVKIEARYYNVADVEKSEEFVDGIEHDFKEIDVLVNNAGVTSTTKLNELMPEEWDHVMNINIRGAFFLSQKVAARMLKRKHGRIINISSISGEIGAKYAGPHYSISKAAIIMMTKVFAKYLADSGITVNSISPGIIATKMTERLKTQINPNEVPMNRMGTAEEVASAVVFIASDSAGYITGQNISVNGGQSMR